VLGLDPGFASIGIAIVKSETLEVQSLRLFETEKSDKKLNVLSTSDNFRRSKEIYQALKGLITEFDPALLALEAMSFPRNSSSAAKMAFSWGVLAALAAETKIPVLQTTPQGIKKYLTGSNKADKEQIKQALFAKYGEEMLMKSGLSGIPKGGHEHPLDALGAVLAVSESEMFNMINGMVKAT
jgi:crossover junction endodeoxyribonuclease RuvC